MTSPTVAGYNADQGYLDAMSRLYGAQRARIGGLQAPRSAYYGAQQGVINARQGLFGPRAAVRGAQGQVYNMQAAQVGQQRNYLGMAQGFNNQRQAELAQLITAQNDSGNIVRTAALNQRREAYAPRFAAGGIGIQRVDLPRGGESNQPNVWANYQTEAQYLQREQGQANAGRDLQLNGAQLAVQLAGTNVDEARIAAGRAGLTLDEAQSMVDEASLQADQAGLGYRQAQDQYGDTIDYAQQDVQDAQLQGKYADMPPYPGAVRFTNPVSGLDQWVTPQEKQYLQQQYGNAQDRLGGDLGGASVDDLKSYIVDDLIDPTDAIREMVRKGMSPARAQMEVQQALLAKERRADGGGSGRTLFGGGAASSQPAAPEATTNGQVVAGYYDQLTSILSRAW